MTSTVAATKKVLSATFLNVESIKTENRHGKNIQDYNEKLKTNSKIAT